MKWEDVNAVIEKMSDGGFVAYLDGFPGVNTQGNRLEDAEEYLVRAFRLLADSSKDRMVGCHKFSRNLSR